MFELEGIEVLKHNSIRIEREKIILQKILEGTMLFYHFDMLDDFIETNSIDTLKKEKEHIEQILKLYENKKINLSSITTNMVETASSIHKKNLGNFYDTLSSLKKLFEDISAIQVSYSKTTILTR